MKTQSHAVNPSDRFRTARHMMDAVGYLRLVASSAGLDEVVSKLGIVNEALKRAVGKGEPTHQPDVTIDKIQKGEV